MVRAIPKETFSLVMENGNERFSKMTDSEIYDWLCKNYWCKGYEMLRECSFIIFNEGRRLKV